MKKPAQFARALIVSAFLLNILAAPPAIAMDEKPIVIVTDTITRILETLSDDSLSEDAARQRVGKIASERINYYEMSKRILAVNWKRADPEQQKRFVNLFREILSNTYWGRIKQYGNEDVVYFTSSIDKEIFATVDTIIQSETVEIPVTYRLKYTRGKWLAYDFLVENQSLISSYRKSFAEIVKNHGIERLLEEMQKRAELPV